MAIAGMTVEVVTTMIVVAAMTTIKGAGVMDAGSSVAALMDAPMAAPMAAGIRAEISLA